MKNGQKCDAKCDAAHNIWLRNGIYYYRVELSRQNGHRRYFRQSLHTGNYYEVREKVLFMQQNGVLSKNQALFAELRHYLSQIVFEPVASLPGGMMGLGTTIKPKRIAFLVPTWPPHFFRAYNLLKSFNKCGLSKQADLIFVFTDEKEHKQFKYICDNVILPKEYRIFDNKGIINIKKFYALNTLQNKYEYIIVLDDESQFIKTTDLYAMCNEFYTKKILYANHSVNDVSEILDSCKRHFPNTAKAIISKHDSGYLWFNQLCIYKTSYLDDFFAKTKIIKNLKELTYVDFDYMIYMFYLIAYHHWNVTLLSTWAPFGMLENSLFIWNMHFDMEQKDTFKPYHCNKNLKHFINTERVFIYIQMNVGEKKKKTVFQIIRRILACLVPFQKLRRK